jgi:hypothetical protein
MTQHTSQTQAQTRTENVTTRRRGFMNWWTAAALAHGAGAG